MAPSTDDATPSKAGIALSVLKQSFQEFTDDDCPRMAAALSYYTVFSLPPLLVLIITIVGVFVSPQDLQGDIQYQMEQLLGADGAEQIQTMIESANAPGSGGTMATILGVLALVFGATGAFAQLQDALNTAWEVRPDPKQGGLKHFIFKRVLSFTMILGVAFLLLISLVVSALLSAFGSFVSEMMGGLSAVMMRVMDLGLSLAIITLLFGALFRVLPDVRIAWRDVWVGAGFTAVLFVIGKFAIGLYLGNSDPGSAYGAAGSLAIVLVWIYYSSMILLLGAEFTQVYARQFGDGIHPDKDAVRVMSSEEYLRSHQRAEGNHPDQHVPTS